MIATTGYGFVDMVFGIYILYQQHQGWSCVSGWANWAFMKAYYHHLLTQEQVSIDSRSDITIDCNYYCYAYNTQ